MKILENLRVEFNNHVTFREKRPGIVQVLAPLFHEDGDMIDIFLDLSPDSSAPIRISDHGLTLMRLSYSYDLDTPAKRKVFGRMLYRRMASRKIEVAYSRRPHQRVCTRRSCSSLRP